MSSSVRTVTAVFVHGIFGGDRTWGRTLELLRTDGFVDRHVDLYEYRYSTPYARMSVGRKIPSLAEVGDDLAREINDTSPMAEAPRLVLVGHSQGGLVIQHLLARALREGRGRELERVKGVVLFATPNAGSVLLLGWRRLLAALGWRHPQEQGLRPFDESAAENQRLVLERIVYAAGSGPNMCPIRFDAFAGLEDRVVSKESARGIFRNFEQLPGDHSSIVKADSANHPACQVIRKALRRAHRSWAVPNGITARTDTVDPTDRNGVDDVLELMRDAFRGEDQLDDGDLRYWLEHYEGTFPGIRLVFLTAFWNGALAGMVMLHEAPAPRLIVVDYIVVKRGVWNRGLVFDLLRDQLEKRARSTSVTDVVFEVEHPEHAARRSRAAARIRMFEQCGARVVEDCAYRSVDMHTVPTPPCERPHHLMCAAYGMDRERDRISGARVREIVEFLYLTWYRNWLSRRTNAPAIARYLEELCTNVTTTIPNECFLRRMPAGRRAVGSDESQGLTSV